MRRWLTSIAPCNCYDKQNAGQQRTTTGSALAAGISRALGADPAGTQFAPRRPRKLPCPDVISGMYPKSRLKLRARSNIPHGIDVARYTSMRFTAVWWATMAVVGTGCVGLVHGAGAGEGGAPQPGAINGAAKGQSVTGLRRLDDVELAYSLLDLTGYEVDPDSLGGSAGQHGYSFAAALNGGLYDRYSKHIAAAAASLEAERLSTYAGCDPLNDEDVCLSSMLNTFARRVY